MLASCKLLGEEVTSQGRRNAWKESETIAVKVVAQYTGHPSLGAAKMNRERVLKESGARVCVVGDDFLIPNTVLMTKKWEHGSTKLWILCAYEIADSLV